MAFVVVWSVVFIIHAKSTVALNNRIRSPIPPLNLPSDDIPMFLTITIDDALNENANEYTGKLLGHTNRNNEQIPLVYFVSNEYTDYSLIQARYLEGCEIAVHTVTHTTGVSTNITKWYYELKTSRQLLSTHADIPMDEIIGFRAPFLEKTDATYQVLNGLNPEFSYDSTIISTLDSNNLFDWPYTLDNYEVSYVYRTGQGPQQSYPGFWEIPMYDLYTDIAAKTIGEIMDYEGNYTLLLDIFKNNFLHRYTTNKSPMGLYFHSFWLEIQSNLDALNDFISWALNKDNTWVVTNKDVINWINNPVTNAQYTLQNNNQLMNDKTDFTTCYYATGQFQTVYVESECPPYLLHNLRWDGSQLISSEITVTSTNDNAIPTLQDMCINDVFTSYALTTIYCATVGTTEVVKYNDILYECQWWTQGEIPGTNSVWALAKDCIQSTVIFVKGTVTPYGAVRVFEYNDLNINIQPYTGYEIDSISVIVGINNYYDLSIFDSYEIVFDAEKNAAALTIRFNKIKVPAYHIEVSFNTPKPSTSPTVNPSKYPTTTPTRFPSVSPTAPSQNPTIYPTLFPTRFPSVSPTIVTVSPSKSPTAAPSMQTISPSMNPTISPSAIVIVSDRQTPFEIDLTDQKTLILVFGLIVILLLVCICICASCLMMKHQQIKMMKKHRPSDEDIQFQHNQMWVVQSTTPAKPSISPHSISPISTISPTSRSIISPTSRSIISPTPISTISPTSRSIISPTPISTISPTPISTISPTPHSIFNQYR